MHYVFRFVVVRLFILIDGFVSWNVSRLETESVAIIRLDAIGDFILWLDSAREYRNLFPGEKITLIANSIWADWARELPYWDDVLAIDLRRFVHGPFYRWKLLNRVGQSKFKSAIQPTFSRVLLHGDSIVRATHAPIRIGSVGDHSCITERDKEISDRWYTQLLPTLKEQLTELERNAEFVSLLKGKTFSAGLPQLPVLATLPKQLQPQADYFIVFPGASWKGRLWPASRFSRVLEHLNRERGWLPVLCGSLAEKLLCEQIREQSAVTCLNLAGQTTLTELAELIRGGNLLISNDTSAIHIAAAVRTPTICVLGGGHFGRFMPYPAGVEGLKPVVAVHQMPCFNCNWHCTQPHDPAGPVPCISGVSVDAVLDLIEQVLDRATNRATSS